jgi:hypothetical protein
MLIILAPRFMHVFLYDWSIKPNQCYSETILKLFSCWLNGLLYILKFNCFLFFFIHFQIMTSTKYYNICYIKKVDLFIINKPIVVSWQIPYSVSLLSTVLTNYQCVEEPYLFVYAMLTTKCSYFGFKPSSPWRGNFIGSQVSTFLVSM